MDTPALSPRPTLVPQTPSDTPSPARETALAFEASFVAEMLKHTGLGKTTVSGSEAFSSFLLEAYAERLVENGGFGLAEQIEAQLTRATPSDHTT